MAHWFGESLSDTSIHLRSNTRAQMFISIDEVWSVVR